MSYEYLYHDVKKLKDKPFIATDILKMIEGQGYKPTAVSVDNNFGSIKIYFNQPLDEKEKKKLDEIMSEFLAKYWEWKDVINWRSRPSVR